MSHNHLHLAALALRKTKTHLILAYYWIRQRIEATPTLKFSPGICFNTQPWFSTLHWGTAGGFNAGKVGLQHFTLLPHCPAIDTQHINLQDLHDKTSILRKEGRRSDRIWVYVQDYNDRSMLEKQQSQVTRCFTTQWFTVHQSTSPNT